jgi:hypothetical protein
MARPRASKDIISKLADVGEEALHKVPDIPGASKILEATNSMRDQLADLTKKVRGIDALEKRVAKLEKQLAQVQGGATRKTAQIAKTTSRAPASRSRTGKSAPTTRKRTTSSSSTRKKTS